MQHVTLTNIGRKIVERRGEIGVRAAAKEIGISPATLSRVENGKLPDLNTFKRICDWLGADAGEVLGNKVVNTPNVSAPAVHFKKDAAISEETAQALGELILYAQRAITAREQVT